MEIFAFLLLFLFATKTCSRHHGLSQSYRSLHARVMVTGEGEERPKDPKPAPKINPFKGPDYEGNGWPEYDYSKGGVEDIAAEKPPWDTFNDIVFKPLAGKLKQGVSGYTLSDLKNGGKGLQVFLERDLFSGRSPPIIKSVGNRVVTYLNGNDDSRRQDRMKALQQIQDIKKTVGDNFQRVFGPLAPGVDDLFTSETYDRDPGEIAEVYSLGDALHTVYKNVAGEQGNTPMQIIDNRAPSDQGTSRVSKLPTNFGKYMPYGYTTFGDLMRKRSVINTITTSEGDSNSDMNIESKYEVYYAAFTAAQSNASDILLPIIEEMLSRSNSSLVWNAAWSLFADLTGSSPAVVGPFAFGFNCIGSLEDAAFALLANSTTSLNQTATTSGFNNTASGHNGTSKGQSQDLSKTLIMATTYEAIEIYNEGWDNATAALAQADLTKMMTALATSLSPKNGSIIPSQLLGNSTPSYDTAYFLEYTQYTS